MLRWLTAGESHGPALVATLDGIPAGVELTTADLQAALARRRLGFGRGARMKFEADQVTVLGGLRHGRTIGSPVAIQIGNTEWPKWQTVMAADPVDQEVLDGQARNAPLTRPRPGHADLAGMQKYDFDEARPVLERASARETAARVAIGRVAQSFCEQAFGVTLLSHVVELGPVRVPAGGPLPTLADLDTIDEHPLRCFDAATGTAMIAEVEECQRAGDTLGGVVEVVVWGLPPGLGSHVHGDRRLDAQLAGALMGIQAIKGVEVGDGFELARTRGSLAHDEITVGPDGIARASHRSGGTEGGMSTGEVLRVRAAMKPIATVPRALRTVDTATGEAAVAHHQRSDVCAVPAAGVVAEAMVALVLAGAFLEKFGGDSVGESRRNAEAYLKHIADRGLRIAGSPTSSAVVVVGAPGSGKSTVGRLLAERLGVPFADVDELIEQAAGKPVGEIFADDGEPHFRALEVTHTLAALDRPGVVSLGGGAVTSPAIRAALVGRTVVWLQVGAAAAARRVGLTTARPLLLGNVRGQLVRLLEQRTPLYAEVATLTVATDDDLPETVLATVLAGLDRTEAPR